MGEAGLGSKLAWYARRNRNGVSLRENQDRLCVLGAFAVNAF
jgi:hypothetical protein